MAGFPEMAAGKLLVMKARGPELGVAKVNKTQTTPTMRIWGARGRRGAQDNQPSQNGKLQIHLRLFFSKNNVA